MTWSQIKARTLNTRTGAGKLQRALVMWSTDAGDMFVHGMMSSGPERDYAPDADPEDKNLHFQMHFETKPGAMPRWRTLPRITYGFRPNQSWYYSNRDMGFQFFGGEYQWFSVPTGRKNKLKFFVPSREANELPGTAQMYGLMARDGWETRQEWATRIKGGLRHYEQGGKLPQDMPITDIFSADELAGPKSVMLRIFPQLIEMVTKEDKITSKSWWEQFGLVTYIEKLSVYEFTELLSDFCFSLYSVPNRNRYQGEKPLFPQDHEYLQGVARDLQERRKVRESEIMADAIAERTGDAAWEELMSERMHMACGNRIQDHKKELSIEPHEIARERDALG